MAKTRDPLQEIIRRNLRRFREEAGLTTENVAAFAGISLDSLRRYENKAGAGVPVSVLIKLADIYGHSLDDFRMEKPPKAELKGRPALALMQLDGTVVPPDDFERIQRAVQEVNEKIRREKKSRK